MTETVTSAIVVGEAVSASAAVQALRACGIRVLDVVEDEGGVRRGLALAPELVVIAVERGAEMLAYRIGDKAAAAGVVTLFIVAAVGTPAVESLVNAVPGSLAIALPLPPAELRTKVAETLAARALDWRGR